jgi:hypothetical protein
MRAGWRSSCPPRWPIWRTGRTAGTGCPVRSGSPTGAMRSPPRPSAALSATTSAATRYEAAGTSTPHGRPPPSLRHPWTSCGQPRWWLLTSTTATSPPPSSRRTATSWAPRPPLPSPWPGCRRPPGTGICAPPSVPARYREGPRRPRHRHRGPRLRRRPRRRTRAGRQPALPRPPRPGLPAAALRHSHRKVPGPAGPDGRQHRAVGHRHRSRLHLPLGSRALAAALAGAPPRSDRSPRGSAGDRATRARAPGQAPRDRDPHRPGGGGTASPGAATPPSPLVLGAVQFSRRDA